MSNDYTINWTTYKVKAEVWQMSTLCILGFRNGSSSVIRGTSRVTCRNFQKVHIERLQICRLLSYPSQIRTSENARMRVREDGNSQTIPRSMPTHKSTSSGWHKTKQWKTLAQTANLKQSRTVKRQNSDQMVNW